MRSNNNKKVLSAYLTFIALILASCGINSNQQTTNSRRATTSQSQGLSGDQVKIGLAEETASTEVKFTSAYRNLVELIPGMKTAIEALTKRVDMIEENLGALTQRVDQIRSDLTAHIAAYTDYTKKTDEAVKILNELGEQHSKRIAENEGKIAKLEEEKEEIKGRLDAAEEINDQLLTDMQDSKDAIGDIRDDISDLEDADDDGQGLMIIKVTDGGLGFPQASIQDIKTKTKLFSTKGTKGEAGTGFGVILVNSYMGLFSGSMEVVNLEDRGSQGTEITLVFKEPSSDHQTLANPQSSVF